MKYLNSTFLLCLIFLLFVTFAFSQDKKDKKKSEVKINVRVTDATDNFVNDIKQEEVKLFEDGVEQKITKFEKKMPLNLGIIVDNSGSMRARLEEVFISGATIVKNLLPGDETFIIRFVSSDKIEILDDWTSDKSVLRKSLENMYVEGGQSAVIDALYLSSQKILERAAKDSSKRYALVLISDGEERDSYYKLKDFSKVINGTDIQIFSIALFHSEMRPLSRTDSRSLIKEITFQTDGAFYFPEKFKKELGEENELIRTLKSIVFELRSQYVISYSPTNKDFEAEKRKLKVVIADSVKGEKRLAKIRENYTAPN